MRSMRINASERLLPGTGKKMTRAQAKAHREIRQSA
jgi:hypothetical protein